STPGIFKNLICLLFFEQLLRIGEISHSPRLERKESRMTPFLAVLPQGHTEFDLVPAVQRILETSPEPLTLTKIRSRLPRKIRSVPLAVLAEAIDRQVAARVVLQYPKYRSQHLRYWDRPMPVHVGHLIR